MATVERRPIVVSCGHREKFLGPYNQELLHLGITRIHFYLILNIQPYRTSKAHVQRLIKNVSRREFHLQPRLLRRIRRLCGRPFIIQTRCCTSKAIPTNTLDPSPNEKLFLHPSSFKHAKTFTENAEQKLCDIISLHASHRQQQTTKHVSLWFLCNCKFESFFFSSW